jgi:hypothetical protein
MTLVVKRLGIGWLEGVEHKLLLGIVHYWHVQLVEWESLGIVYYWHVQLVEWERSSPDAIAAPLLAMLPKVLA